MKHTRPPWEIKDVGYPKDREFWIVANQNVVAKIANLPVTDNQPEANAKLIAAAPDLLEACKAVRDKLGGMSYYPDIFDIVQKAITKAEGK